MKLYPISKEKCLSSLTAPRSDLPEGTYFYRVVSGASWDGKKFITEPPIYCVFYQVVGGKAVIIGIGGGIKWKSKK